MSIVFRVDASVEIGSGHVMRCLTLANQLKKNDEIIFVCRDTNGHLKNLIVEKGYRVILLPKVQEELWDWTKIHWQQDILSVKNSLQKEYVDLLIVDHYSIDYKWENTAKQFAKKIMVIDDLANRKHSCDILLDQNFYSNLESRYNDLVEDSTIKLLGPNYVLLREEFFNTYTVDEKMSIFVFFGAADRTNETEKTLNALINLRDSVYNFNIHVVVGEMNDNKSKIKEICTTLDNCYYYCQIDNMAEVLSKCTFSISAGGTFTWERSALNVPGFIIAIAENQFRLTEDLAMQQATGYLGRYYEVTEQTITDAVRDVFDNPKILSSWIENMQKIVQVEQLKENLVVKNLKEVLKSC